ncbi:beta-aspartyl-peptidase [Peptococcus simiae]|uniref:beta-aspartyl-peptidase n=1 Tax=Peptococcus simiae TaxID=1643805 RepID=UPI00397FD8F4
MICIEGARVYAPHSLGKKNIYIAGEKIIGLSHHQPAKSLEQVIFAEDLIAIPGLVDLHVHITGGGGEAGMMSRSPELSLETMIRAGVTTVAGLLGTDTVTRSLENLLGKARALREEGVSAVIYTGGYDYPSPTLTGNIRRDIFLIQEVHGVKLSLADHRSSYPQSIEIERLLSDVRVAGMLRNKVFQLHVHIGDEEEKLSSLLDIATRRPQLSTHITATHLNRSEAVFADGLALVKAGANMDISTGLSSDNLHVDTLSAEEAVKKYVDLGLPLDQLTLSSDGNGSAAEYNADGTVAAFKISRLDSLLKTFQTLVNKGYLSFSDALALVTAQPAKRLGLAYKGKIAENMDADLVLLRKDLSLYGVMARGKLIYQAGD